MVVSVPVDPIRLQVGADLFEHGGAEFLTAQFGTEVEDQVPVLDAAFIQFSHHRDWQRTTDGIAWLLAGGFSPGSAGA